MKNKLIFLLVVNLIATLSYAQSVTRSFDVLHRLTQEEYGTYKVLYSYDRNNNLISKEVKPYYPTLNLNLFLQGYYTNAGLMNPVLSNQGLILNNAITDSIDIKIHTSTFPYTLVSSHKSAININGNSQVLLRNLSSESSYFLEINHRNSIPTWSSNPVLFSGDFVSFDFTTSASQAYGNNQVEMEPGVWALYSGDLNSDGNIDQLDLSVLEADISLFQFGYYATDINGDGNVDIIDNGVLENNINAFIFTQHP